MNWVETAAGYTVAQKEDGFWYYVERIERVDTIDLGFPLGMVDDIRQVETNITPCLYGKPVVFRLAAGKEAIYPILQCGNRSDVPCRNEREIEDYDRR